MSENKILHEEELLMLTTFPELIGGLAHDFAQPLNAISLICEVCRIKVDRLELSEGDAKFFRDKLENINGQVLRATETFQSVRRYVSFGDNAYAGNLENSLSTIAGLLRQQFISRGIDFSFNVEGEFHEINIGSVLLDLMVAQCLVLARNRVEAIGLAHNARGLNYSRKIEVFLSTDENADFLTVKWGVGNIENKDGTEDLPATLLVGLSASELLIRKYGGKMEIDDGYISLILKH